MSRSLLGEEEWDSQWGELFQVRRNGTANKDKAPDEVTINEVAIEDHALRWQAIEQIFQANKYFRWYGIVQQV